jgi:predicted O-linked N-acetylglucosamine transferase (SPINDLY family)
MEKLTEKPNLNKKLRIGYILPDLRPRNTAFVSTALIEFADTERFDIFCYAQGGESYLKERVAKKPINWRSLEEKPEFAVQVVASDRLDYLVDLSSHLSRSVQAILKRRSAPVQLSTLGYFNTTGIENVDYLLSDRLCTPENGGHGYFAEKVIYIPQTFMAYTPRINREPYVSLPLARNGYITFGCFHHFSRLTDEFLQIWQRILAKVPKSRLVLKSRIFSNAYGCEETRYRFKRLGYDISRIDFRAAKLSDIDEYKNIDIILDTVPYQGVVTTCDALYMGVPVIAFAGKKHSMRMGCSILHQVGLAECVAYDVESYIEKAVSLSDNRYRLANLHKNLRENMLAAPLMDGVRYAHNVENIFLYLCESAEKRRSENRLLNEISNSISGVETKLVFLHGRLVAGDVSKKSLNVFNEILYTFHNTKLAATKFTNMDMVLLDGLVASCRMASKKAEAGNVIKACEEISEHLMPRIKDLLVILDELKMSTLS